MTDTNTNTNAAEPTAAQPPVAQAPVATPAPTTPAGWYADTTTPGQQRYWDGTAWTEHVAPGVAASAAAPAPQVVVHAYAPAPSNGAAVTGFVLVLVGGVLGLFFGWLPVASWLLIAGLVVGIVLSIVGLVKANGFARQGLPASGRGLAISGIVIGGVLFLIDLIIVLTILAAAAAFVSTFGS